MIRTERGPDPVGLQLTTRTVGQMPREVNSDSDADADLRVRDPGCGRVVPPHRAAPMADGHRAVGCSRRAAHGMPGDVRWNVEPFFTCKY